MNEGDVDFAMYQMAAKHFRLPIQLIQQPNRKDAFSPPSEEDTYLIKDDLEQVQGLVKVFMTTDEGQEKEVEEMIQGIRLIGSLNLHQSIPSIPIDFEKAVLDTDEKPYIALLSAVEGRSLLGHIQYLTEQARSSLERSQALEILCSGYRQAALALAELHTKRFSPLSRIAGYYWTSHMEVCQANVRSLKTYVEMIPFDLNMFSDKLIRMAATAYAKPCSAAFLHGNPSAISMAYEPFNEVLSLQDLEKAYHSIDEKGRPCGPSAYDYVWAAASCELHMVCAGADYDEIRDVLDEYRVTYKQAMKERFPSDLHATFYTLLFWLPIYKALVVKYDGDEAFMKQTESSIFKLALSKLQPILE